MSSIFKAGLFFGFVAALIAIGAMQLGAFDHLDFLLTTRYQLEFKQAFNNPELQRLAVVVLAVFTAYLVLDVVMLGYRWLLVGVIFLEIFFGTWLLAYFDHYFSPFPSATAVLLAAIGASLYSLTSAGNRKAVATALLHPRYAADRISAIVESRQPLPMPPEIREASVLVLEVVNHEALLESANTAGYIDALNRMLTITSRALLSDGAYLDACDGSAVVAIFGAPLPNEAHAATASRVALELGRRLDNLNLEIERGGLEKIDFRLAVNSGEILTAVYGSGALQRYGVGGHAVDFARTLCQLNVRYHTRLLLGPLTRELASDLLEVRPVDLIPDPESTLPVEIYEIVGAKGQVTMVESGRRDLYWDGVVLFREGRHQEAIESFQRAQPVGREDGLIRIYLDRIDQLRRKRSDTGAGVGLIRR